MSSVLKVWEEFADIRRLYGFHRGLSEFKHLVRDCESKKGANTGNLGPDDDLRNREVMG